MNFIYRSFVYDFLYQMADTAVKRENPCRIHTDMDKAVCARSSIAGHAPSPCCGGCQYISDTGCTTKCLRCKLYACETFSGKLYDNLWRMLGISRHYNLSWMRKSREWAMDNLKEQRMGRGIRYKMM